MSCPFDRRSTEDGAIGPVRFAKLQKTGATLFNAFTPIPAPNTPAKNYRTALAPTYFAGAHEYLEKTPGAAPYLRDIHVHNPAGFVSFGLPIGDVPSMRRDIPLVVSRVGRDLFLADLDNHQQRITGTIAPDFTEDIYTSAVWQTGVR
jgi:hypothetical protein